MPSQNRRKHSDVAMLATLLVFPRPKDDRPLGTCPACGLTVNLRQDGTASSHRVGLMYKQALPCAGASQPAGLSVPCAGTNHHH